MEDSNLKIVWLKQCLGDFEKFGEKEFIRADKKLKEAVQNIYQNTSSVKGTNLRRLRIGNKRLFFKIIENQIYCVGYKTREKAYNKDQLKEMDKIIKKILSEQGL